MEFMVVVLLSFLLCICNGDVFGPSTQSAVEAIKKEKRSIQSDINVLKDNMHELLKRVIINENEIFSLKSENQFLTNKIENERRQLSCDINVLHENTNEQQRALTGTNAEINHLNETIDHLRNDVDKLEELQRSEDNITDCIDKPVTKSKYICRFETDVPCIFKDSSQDDFDWIRRSGMTLSLGTGPSRAAVGYYYIYIEATSTKYGDKAILTTEPYNLQAIRWCLTFQYHMKGSSVGSLEVFAGDKSSSLTSIWTKTGMQPNPDLWKTATIDIPQFSDPAITIEGSTGPSYQGDIAIDDLTLDAGTCNTQQ